MAVSLSHYQSLLEPIEAFLGCATPDAWLAEATEPGNLPLLLIDHCNCELKAAQTAIWLIRRYAVDGESGKALLAWVKPYEDFVYRRAQGDFGGAKNALIGELKSKDGFSHGPEILDKMIRLIKEELHHFEQVLEILAERQIPYATVTAARYAKGLIAEVRDHEPWTLVDKLIVGAFIEARSCERFARLAPLVDEELGRFYVSLLRSEARHYQDYLSLARQVAGTDIDERVALFRAKEAELIQSPDSQLRFHSGIPATTAA
ncbi:tRNA isopentenyl-2-thiomethyl-A-37 hydroxylase MiaE [Gallaecimonas kandeliae]|uniref:tRNA isopentenyl-2-thiomethyl-A-37 hydroxylase MiaE n=1 Tax=Gallaecimonas kandeliae TaxID=3029055 RepID=UPI0026477400|nr:tRNA isopentenyl-2-thiomethyl-A-37 hydroxylase MiaE [Gallaecimonas kandeliae]WKE64153.1 tRNA isopentenyl-2-thiomethyl-A-37 hydroxylase MiaE [Gallaecimonas kandeliae]